MSGLQVILPLSTASGHLRWKQTFRHQDSHPQVVSQLQTDTVQCSFEFRMTHTNQMRLPEAKVPISEPPEEAPETTVPQII